MAAVLHNKSRVPEHAIREPEPLCTHLLWLAPLVTVNVMLLWTAAQHKQALLSRALLGVGQAMLQAGLIIAGWDAHDGGSVYGVPLGGTLVKVPFTIGADAPLLPCATASLWSRGCTSRSSVSACAMACVANGLSCFCGAP